MRIAIASGKGGTGKTTVAVNLALTAVRMGQKVHLVDCDVEEPNAHLFLKPDLGQNHHVTLPVPQVDQALCQHCGQCAEFCEFNAIACLPQRTMIFEDLCHGCSGCWLICPNQAITKSERVLGDVATGTAMGMSFTHGELRIGETVVPPLIQAAKAQAENANWVILDSPPGTTCPVVETMRDVDYVVLVTEPTPFGQHDLALAVDLARALERPCGVVINRAVPGREQIEAYCARESLDILAKIPFQLEVAEACAEGGLAIDVDKQVADALVELYEKLMAREVPV